MNGTSLDMKNNLEEITENSREQTINQSATVELTLVVFGLLVSFSLGLCPLLFVVAYEIDNAFNGGP